MRATAFAGAMVSVVIAAGAAAAQPAPAPASEPAPPAGYAPPPPPATTATYQQPYQYQPPAQPAAEPEPRHNWFGTIGVGGMGYAGRTTTPYDDGNKGSGVMLEAVAGKWIRDDAAIGARLEAHTDDSKHYTDSSFTLIARFPVGAGGRFYLEPGIGASFHKDEMRGQTDNGLAVSITGGYQLARHRLAVDLRFGGAHYRFDPDDNTHGLLWFGIAIGFQ